MEARFPTAAGYAGLFCVGVRKRADLRTERTGTVVLKRTYVIDPVPGTLTPAPEPLPVFVQDTLDNLVENGDFEASEDDYGTSNDPAKPAAWAGETATLALVPPSPAPANQVLRVTGAARARGSQVITLDAPLDGRRFTLSLSARANAPARIEGVQLEAEGSTPRCVVNANLTTSFQRLFATGSWPAGLGATKMRVVLRAATNPARVVEYDDVQVEERGVPTTFDPKTTLRYEHDLAPYKPRADLIVLGFTGLPGLARVLVDGTLWLQRTLPSARQKALFGWEPRSLPPRKGEAGSFPTDPAAYPLADPLPADFQNGFYNGFLRSANQLSGPSYLPETALVRVRRFLGQYRFNLHGDSAEATYSYASLSGPDLEAAWISVPVPMRLDTLVVEPEQNRCYLVWRGAWPLDDHPEASYRRLVVTASA